MFLFDDCRHCNVLYDISVNLQTVYMNYSIICKSFLMFFLLYLISDFSFGQKTEINVNAYGGMFFFRGNGATSTATVGFNDVLGYYNPNPFGKRTGFSYAFEVQLQRVTNQNHLFGAGIGLEKLVSREGIDSVWSDVGKIFADGKVTLSNYFLTANPYIGQRFATKKMLFDVMAGFDFAFSLKVYEEAKIDEGTYNLHRAKYDVDYRSRIQIGVYQNRIGWLAGYSLGLKNLYHYDNPYYTNKKSYANFLRLGISYKLK